MKLTKYFLVITAALVNAASLTAQQQGQEMTVEEFYLKESVPMMIIREQAASEDREGKLIALDYIKEAMDNGDKSDAIRAVLQDIALEGILNKTRSEGRVANNYSEVRMRAVNYLGEIGTKAASDALIKVVLVEEEPAVITEAFRSLAKIDTKIDMNKTDGRPLDTANWIFSQFNTVNPDNRLALSYLDAIEGMLPKMPVGSARDNASEEDKRFARIRNDTMDKLRGISTNYKYITPVRDKAKAVLAALLAKNK